MCDLKSKISYLKGLADGMQLEETNEKKLIMEIINVMDKMAEAIHDLEVTSEETQEYLESIDEDLGELEEDFYGSEEEIDEDDYDMDDYDFDDEDFIEMECPGCHEIVYIDEDLVDGDGISECPNCKTKINVHQK